MELTYDVLVQIFKYLSKCDRLSASETCRSWHEATNDPYFRKNKVVMFYESILDDETLSPLHIFEDSTNPYAHYHFSDIDITEKFNSFWNKQGDAIRTVTLEHCIIGRREFIFLLQKCKNLESLNIVEGLVKFHDDLAFDEDILDNSLTKLKSLSFFGAMGLSDALFARFMSAAPALEKLDLSISTLQFDPKIVRKYYPPECSHVPSQTVLTFYFILQSIKPIAKNIKCLKFIFKYNRSYFDSAALQLLLETENLKLESLKLRRLSEVVDLTALTTHHIFLKELSIDSCYNITDRSLIDISKNLVNLEHLDISQCRKVTDVGISKLSYLKKLRSLNVSYCEEVTQDGLIGGICAEINKILEDLQVASLPLDPNAVITISERLPNLRSLNLRHCRKGVTDLSLQFIFKNQLLLHTLNISYCYEVTDAGLTGMKIVEPDEDYKGSLFTSNFHQSPPMKRIKIEKEIVYVGEQKLGYIFCAKQILATGVSLSHLKHLKELNISGCYNITDVSLAHAFNFKGLTKLNLDVCDKLTRIGLKCLVENCPTIEHLCFYLNGCDNIKDNEFKETVKCLRWLKRLDISTHYIRVRRPGNEITFLEPLIIVP